MLDFRFDTNPPIPMLIKINPPAKHILLSVSQIRASDNAPSIIIEV